MGKKRKAQCLLPPPPPPKAKAQEPRRDGAMHASTRVKGHATAAKALAARAPTAVTPAKAEPLWDPATALSAAAWPAPRPPAAVAPLREAVAAAEAGEARKRLAARFAAAPGARGAAPPLAFERWQLAEGAPLPTTAAAAPADDLVRAGLGAAAAARCVAACAGENAAAASRLAALAIAPAAGAVVVAANRHSADVTLARAAVAAWRGPLRAAGLAAPPASLLLKVTHAHLEKLRALHGRAAGGGGGGGGAFEDALFCVLLRYRGAAGHGFHAALPAAAFAALRDDFGVCCEAFASPLNCFFARFCSAHFDVDAPFGSLGSFFDFAPASGSYEVNPPFVEAVMARAVAHCEALLARATGPLAFAVVLPGWADSPAFGALGASRHKTAQVLVARADHGYVDGAQHQRRDRHRASPYDTIVVFLQTPSARAIWPPTPAALGRLRAALARGVPTAAEAARRLKAGRGAAPEDGGAGRYRGPKHKRHKAAAAPEPRRAAAPRPLAKKRKKKKKKKKENPAADDPSRPRGVICFD